MRGGAALAVAGTAAGRQPTDGDPDQTPPLISEEQRREAMEYGVQAHCRLGRGAAWDDAEPSLRTHWANSGRSQRTAWNLARDAVRAGWEGEA